MKPVLFVLPILLAACSAAPIESTASMSEAIDPTHTTTVPLKSFIVPPKLTKVVAPPAKNNVINLNAIKKLPGVLWALNTKSSVAPVYVTCSPGFQAAQTFCYNTFIDNANLCDSNYSIATQDCANYTLTCQQANCTAQYNFCVDEIPDCFGPDPTCQEEEQNALNACGNASIACDTQIQSNGICGSQFTACANSAEAEDGSCRSFAASEYDACGAPIGLCF